MKRPITFFVLALVSLVVSPILVVLELSALFLSGMVNAEPSNSAVIKVLSVAVVVAIALLALALPVIAVIGGSKARAASKQAQAQGSGLATAAVVIAGIVTAGVLIAQVYYVMMVTGTCSLEGC